MSEEKEVKRSFPVSRYLLDFVMCLVAAVAMVFVVCGGFHVSPHLQYNIVPLVLVPAAFLAAMTALARFRVNKAVACIGMVVAAVAVIAVLAMATGQQQVLADVESNPCVFVLLCALVSSLVFLLTRTFPGSIALFVIASLFAGIIQFLYHFNYVVMSLLMVAALIAIMVFKYYQRAYSLADAKDTPRYGAAFIAGVITSVVLVLVGSLLWVGIDAAFHPQALELKPFKEYFAYEEIPVMGVANSTQVEDEDKTSSNTNNDTSFEGGLSENHNQEKNKDDSKDNNNGLPTEGSMIGYTQDSMEEAFEVIGYSLEGWKKFALIVLLALLLVAPIVVRKVLRRRWYESVLAKSNEEQAVDFYLFFLDRFEKMGLGKPQSVTALGFGEAADVGVSAFESASNVSFKALSETYTSCAYGGKPVSDEVAEGFRRFYDSFYKCCIKQVGRFKYLVMFFKL